AHALRAALGVESVVTTHQRNDEAEHGGFVETRLHVGMGHEVDGVFYVDGAVEIEARRRHDVAAAHADGIRNRDEDRQRQQRSPDARYDQVLDGVGGERRQSVDLLSHSHGADLGSNRRADATGYHEAGDHRAQFACYAEYDNLRHDRFRAIAVTAYEDLQCQHA